MSVMEKKFTPENVDITSVKEIKIILKAVFSFSLTGLIGIPLYL